MRASVHRLGLLVGALGLAGCGTPGPLDTDPVAWQTATVSLAADDFWIVADGQSFPAPSVAVDVHSDPGEPASTTLEVTWRDHDREMRFLAYFSADETSWWSDEIRTYDAQASGEWLYYEGTFFKSPIGAPFHGNIDLTNASSDPFRGELHILGLTLSTTLTGR